MAGIEDEGTNDVEDDSGDDTAPVDDDNWEDDDNEAEENDADDGIETTVPSRHLAPHALHTLYPRLLTNVQTGQIHVRRDGLAAPHTLHNFSVPELLYVHARHAQFARESEWCRDRVDEATEVKDEDDEEPEDKGTLVVDDEDDEDEDEDEDEEE